MTRTPLLNIIAALFFPFVGGCGSGDCASKATADEQDWCYHASAVEHARRDELQPSLDDLAKIQAPMVRAFAVQELMVAAPRGMSKEQAEGLCRSLASDQSEACMRTWSRPHLWEK